MSQTPAPDTGSITRQERDIMVDQALRSTLTTPRESGLAVTSPEAEPVLPGSEVAVYVERFVVQGRTVVPNEVFRKILSPYERKRLTFNQINEAVSKLTDEYHRRGYRTSFVYLPPQDIEGGVIRLNVLEGRVGQVRSEGNRYVTSKRLARQLVLSPGQYFDFRVLERAMLDLNQNPDRRVRAFLMPGSNPRTTDVVLAVSDRRPWHVDAGYDNFGSRYTGKNRASVGVRHNDLTGNDDQFQAELQKSDARNNGDYAAWMARYMFPVTTTLRVSVHAMENDVELGREFAALAITGRSRQAGAAIEKTWVRAPKSEISTIVGFDRKSVRNRAAGENMFRDELSVARLGATADLSDRFGRTLIAPEVSVGIPRFLGANESKDPESSREGAGGSFNKETINVYRIQPLGPFAQILAKTSGQWTPYRHLPSTEEFQLGGPSSVRAYPLGEASGERGVFGSVEMSVPVWKNFLSAAVFYDAGWVRRMSPSLTEERSSTLRGWGWGARFRFRDNLTGRVDLGYPLGDDPSDGRNVHPWVEVTVTY